MEKDSVHSAVADSGGVQGLDVREWLELAAKAIGLEFLDASPCGGLFVSASTQGSIPMFVVWNPLKDDGDCARLESALLIELLWHDDGVQAGRRMDSFAVYDDFRRADRNVIRRWVVVELAARIGKAMP